jgi:hypothetical protein
MNRRRRPTTIACALVKLKQSSMTCCSWSAPWTCRRNMAEKSSTCCVAHCTKPVRPFNCIRWEPRQGRTRRKLAIPKRSHVPLARVLDEGKDDDGQLADVGLDVALELDLLDALLDEGRAAAEEGLPRLVRLVEALEPVGEPDGAGLVEGGRVDGLEEAGGEGRCSKVELGLEEGGEGRVGTQ